MPEQAQQRTRLAWLLVWLIPVLWAASYVVARRAPGVIGPHLLALGRWTFAAVVLLAFSGRELWQQRAEVARVWWQYAILGTLGMLVCGAWVYQGARSTSTMNIALIYATLPVLIALGSARWLGERFSGRQALGVALALAGVLHVVLKGQWMALAAVRFVSGAAWILSATVAWAVLGESLGWHHLAGAALILPGVFLVTGSRQNSWRIQQQSRPERPSTQRFELHGIITPSRHIRYKPP